MGNETLKAPKTEKIRSDGKNSILKYGVCEMQGWRHDMVYILLKIGRFHNFFYGL